MSCVTYCPVYKNEKPKKPHPYAAGIATLGWGRVFLYLLFRKACAPNHLLQTGNVQTDDMTLTTSNWLRA
jgi:hypothetical protein